MPPKLDHHDLADAARLLREVLALVEMGELAATTPPRAVSTVRRLEGAAVALETAAGIKPQLS
jgi:hypothetical protein